MKKHTALFILFLVTVIWGGGFPATKLALDYGVTVGLMNMIRGAIFSLLILVLFGRYVFTMKREHLKIGILAGVFNSLGFLLQTLGAQHTTLSNNAFLTTTNVVMIPFIAWVMLKHKPKVKNFMSVAICMVGTAVLAGIFHNGFSFNIGDIYSLLCALCYAFSIVLLAMQHSDSHFAAGAFLVGITHFLGGAIYFVVAEGAYMPPIDWATAIVPLLYLSLGSSFLAQSLQVAAQRYVSPSSASLVLMFESVFGSLFSILFGFEVFTLSLVIGGSLIILSLVVSEVDFKTFKKGKKQLQ